jgi:transposase
MSEALGMTKGAVSQWLKKAKTGGVETLHHRKGTGASSHLTPIQKSELLELLSKGAESYGFHREIWTCERVAEVIRWHYGVSYHSHVSRILRIIGGVFRSLNEEQSSEMKKRFGNGWKRNGLRSEKRGDEEWHNSICRSIRFLSSSFCNAYLCSQREDARDKGTTNQSSSIVNEWYNPGW